jgi:hypothetical protein
VKNPDGVCRGVRSIELDDQLLATSETSCIPLMDDGVTHRVRVVLGSE